LKRDRERQTRDNVKRTCLWKNRNHTIRVPMTMILDPLREGKDYTKEEKPEFK
jgi:uncharacterized protein YeeX (DUF496 family)